MKFYVTIFILLSASLVFSNRLYSRNVERNGVFINIDFNTISKTAECQQDLNEYQDCLALFKYSEYADNFNDLCTVVNSENCQIFYEDPMLYLPNCIDNDSLAEALDVSIINICLSRVNVGCETDENGKLCPIAKSFLDGAVESYNQLFDETCKSGKCTNALIDAFRAELEFTTGAEQLSYSTGHLDNSTQDLMYDFINDLSTEKCSNMSGSTPIIQKSMKAVDADSAAYSIKITTSLLLIALSLCLYYFF